MIMESIVEIEKNKKKNTKVPYCYDDVTVDGIDN